MLIDADLNAAALRMYNENTAPAGYAISLQEARHGGESANPLCIYLEALINQKASPWQDFPETGARAVRVRAHNLKARINEKP